MSFVYNGVSISHYYLLAPLSELHAHGSARRFVERPVAEKCHSRGGYVGVGPLNLFCSVLKFAGTR